MGKETGESDQSLRRDGPIIHEGEVEGTEGESASQVLRRLRGNVWEERVWTKGVKRREASRGRVKYVRIDEDGRRRGRRWTKERTKEQEVG